MSNTFLARLRINRDRIRSEIERERQIISADPLRLVRLKKLKLSVKDRIARVEAQLAQ